MCVSQEAVDPVAVRGHLAFIRQDREQRTCRKSAPQDGQGNDAGGRLSSGAHEISFLH